MLWDVEVGGMHRLEYEMRNRKKEEKELKIANALSTSSE